MRIQQSRSTTACGEDAEFVEYERTVEARLRRKLGKAEHPLAPYAGRIAAVTLVGCLFVGTIGAVSYATATHSLHHRAALSLAVQ